MTLRHHHRTALMLSLALAAFLTAAPSTSGQVGRNLGVLNPNLASVDSLLALPGFDRAAVDAVVAGRPFADMLAVDAVLARHLGDFDRDALYASLFLPLNLNATTREEILLVPGVGERMAHEFEEYAPYVHMAEFRREIGKYVDDAEVARLEQFVFVPIDLNAATDEDILSIPGLGARMLHEFKEYRPYRAIEQFRREIGKYVDDAEVSRLERYVRVGSGG